MKNIIQRTFSGLVYLIIVIGSLILGKYTFGAVFLLIGILALIEFYTISGIFKSRPYALMGILIGAMAFIISFLVVTQLIAAGYLSLLVMLPLLAMIGMLYDNNNRALPGFTGMIAGVLYIFLPLVLMLCLAFPPVTNHLYTYRIILGILSLIWINDTSAYLFGITIGRHRLFQRISPKKSWEGFIGGSLITILISLWMNKLTGILSVTDWIILAVIVSVFGVYGDLAESLIKRNYNRKDSGSIIPGHGGVLDRIDSILFVMPVAYFYLIIQQI